MSDLDLTRRELCTALGAGSLLVFHDRLHGEPISTRLHIGDNGIVTLMTGKVEIGQGARTELAQVVAEEMHVNPARVRLIMGDTALVPDDGGTWASLTTPRTVPVVRRAAAAAYKQTAGEVVDPSDWQVCGTSLPRVTGRDIVTGAKKYSRDLRAPGMLYGKVKRASAYRAKLVSAQTSEAAKIPGVTVVHEGDFIGVTALDRRTAEAAIEKIEAEGTTEPLVTADKLASHFKRTAQAPVFRQGAKYPALIERGSVDEGMAAADIRLQSTYECRYIAHLPLEPRSALTEWTQGGIVVRTGTQVPFGAQRSLAKAFNLPEDKVRVIASDCGAGFGGKHRAECQLEAARLAKAAGKPVLLEWSREEESTCSYCRPAGVVEVRSGAHNDGEVTAWDFHNYNAGSPSLAPPYEFANVYCGFHRASAPLRQGAYRSLAAVINTFAREMQMEELARRCRMEPLEFRLRNLRNERMKAVLERAADRFGWGKQKSGNGRGFGLASNLEKGGHLALAVEVETDGKSARVRRSVVAMDCGAIINPGNLRNQIAGALIQGIGGALFEELHYDERQIQNPWLSTYRVPRFSDVPEIEIELVDRRDEPSAGAGESPITVIAPAIGAALYNATGQWFRSLPMF